MSAPTPTSTTAPAGLATGHIGLNVVDLDRSLAFYRRVLGFDVASEGNDGDQRWAFLALDGQVVLTLWQQAGGGFQPAAAGLHHLSYAVDSVEAVREVEARLHDLGAGFAYDGVVPHAESADSGGIYFHDPDGVRLEIFARTGAGGAPAPHGSAPTCGFF
ncbi:MAG TPA: VOC family protein [Acidimicrobiales bacterium]|nr:VOC family protein [Acidimicrobiales bacterium]